MSENWHPAFVDLIVVRIVKIVSSKVNCNLILVIHVKLEHITNSEFKLDRRFRFLQVRTFYSDKIATLLVIS